eukprot:gene20127-26133_t
MYYRDLKFDQILNGLKQNSNNEEVSLSENRFTNTGSTLINGVQSEQAQIDDKSNLDENEILDPSISPYQTIMSNYLTNNKKTKPKIRKVEMSLQNIDKASSSNKPFDVEIEEFDNEDSDDNFWDYFYNLEKRLCGIKNDSFVRLIRVLLSFPFVIVAATINPNSRLSIFTSLFAIRFVNTLIYVVPIILVEFVLSKYLTKTLQTAVIRVTFSTSKIEEGTFCFKPARTVKLSQANFYAMTGFAFDWLQHVLYVIPTGILTSNRRVARLSDFPPFLKFDVYFWTAVAGSFACGLILILNAVLRGKLHYKYQKTNWIWILLYNLSSPMFVSFITVMFMGLSCDYSLSPPTLIQDPTIVCYSNRHKVMVQCALIALSVYILQNTLLPSGTFKETMRGNDLDIMFVPVGSLKSWTATVYITIYDERTFYDEDVDETNKDGNKYSRYKNKQDDYIDDDDIEQGHVTDRPSDEFDDDMNDPIDPDEIYDTYPNNDNHSNYKKSFEVKNNYRSRLPSKRSNRSDINSDVN